MKLKRHILSLVFLLLTATSSAFGNCDHCAIPFMDMGSCTANCDNMWPGADCNYCYDDPNGMWVYCCYPSGGDAPELPPGALPFLMVATLFVIAKAKKVLDRKGVKNI